MRLAALLCLAALASCGGDGGGGEPSDPPVPPAPVDGVGVFTGSMGYRYAPEMTGYSGGGPIIADGSLALGGWRSTDSGLVLDYRYTRSGNGTSGSLVLRGYLRSQRCSGPKSGTVADNAEFDIGAYILTNESTGQECRGGASGTYSAAWSEYPAASIAEFTGSYASTEGPSGFDGGFDVGGNRFMLTISDAGSILLNGQCTGTVALVEPGKGIARVSGIAPTSCGNAAGAAIDGLMAFNGAELLVFLVQPGTYYFWSGTLQKQ